MNKDDQTKIARVIMSVWQLYVLAQRSLRENGVDEKAAVIIANRLAGEIADLDDGD